MSGEANAEARVYVRPELSVVFYTVAGPFIGIEPYLKGPKDFRPQGLGPWHVPNNDLFVLGDNRTNSNDSRFGLGYIPIHKVVGKAFIIIWPPSHFGGIEHHQRGLVVAVIHTAEQQFFSPVTIQVNLSRMQQVARMPVFADRAPISVEEEDGVGLL